MSSGVSEVVVDVSGIDALLQAEPERVEAWLDGVAEEIVTDIKLSFGTSPPGRAHRRGKVVHIASQPGYPPNVDIGALINSVRWEPTGRLERQVMDGVEYGLGLEDGTDNIKPRPWMVPAFDRARAWVEADAAQKLRLE